MILLQANNVSRRFADQTLYQEVNFSIQDRDRIALIGRNGTGKSTLIKQIMNEEPINDGTFSRAKGLTIGYLEQHVALHSTQSIWDEMMSVFSESLTLRQEAIQASQAVADLADKGQFDSPAYQEAIQRYDQVQLALEEKNVYQIESDVRTVLHGFGFKPEDYQTPVNSLSGGQKTRLALAQILLKNYDLLVLDEPTNHLDVATLTWLEQYLLSYKGALLIVSHDRYFLDRVVNQVFEMRHHRLHLYKGNYSDYIVEKEAQLEKEMKEYLKQQTQIHKLEDFIKRNIVRASTTKRAQSRRKQLEKMDRIEKPKQDVKAPRIQFTSGKESGERVLEAEDLTIGYQVHQPLAQAIQLELKKQDAIAIVGPNGVGKTTLLKTLLHQLPPLQGTFKWGTNVSIGYYDQNVNQLDESRTVLETLWQAHDTTDEWQIRSILGSFLFSGDTVDKKVSMLSGGEKARLALALLATDHDNTLLLDEPTNHLDLDSKEVLEEALIEYDGTLLFVSHDRYFINRIATQVIEISPEGSTLYLGDYDYYLAKKAEMEAFNQEPDATDQKSLSHHESSPNDYEVNKRIRSDYKKLQASVEAAWARSETIDQTIANLHEEMAQAAQENDQDRLLELDQTLKQKQEAAQEAIDHWEVAALALEDFLERYPHLAP